MTTFNEIDSFNFDSENPNGSISHALKNNITYFNLIPRYDHANLEFLLPIKDKVEGLVLNDKVSLDQLHQFKNLKFLGGLNSKREFIDFQWFPNLEILAAKLTANTRGLEHLIRLKHLTVSYYNPKCKDLTALPTLVALESLNIIKSNINSLAGVEKFSDLKKFEIYAASKLVSCDPLQYLKNLSEVCFESCKQVEDFEALGKIRSLRKIMLTSSGRIKSLNFVKELPSLEFISFVKTNVVDGDVSHCERINYVGFDDKRHYNRKMKYFRRPDIS